MVLLLLVSDKFHGGRINAVEISVLSMATGSAAVRSFARASGLPLRVERERRVQSVKLEWKVESNFPLINYPKKFVGARAHSDGDSKRVWDTVSRGRNTTAPIHGCAGKCSITATQMY